LKTCISLCNSREANLKEVQDVCDGSATVVGMADGEDVVEVVTVVEGGEGWSFFVGGVWAGMFVLWRMNVKVE
jgi:hypothetical protein